MTKNKYVTREEFDNLKSDLKTHKENDDFIISEHNHIEEYLWYIVISVIVVSAAFVLFPH